MAKTYKKIISLEPLTSRVPGVLPAYDNEGNLLFFDDDSIQERGGEYRSNYGLIPIAVSFSSLPKEIGCGNYTLSCGNQISFETLSRWYGFFKMYYNLLRSSYADNTVYGSALEYYRDEVLTGRKSGLDEEYYEELDRQFKEYGGCTMKTESGCFKSVTDKGFYGWICENIIPTFNIPSEFVDAWNRNTLYYPDVAEWIGWFCARSAKYDKFNINNCNESDDCCECEKYHKLGGSLMASELSEWYDKVQSNILKLNESLKCKCGCLQDHYPCTTCEFYEKLCDNECIKCKCYEPYLHVPVTLRGSLDNVGLFFDPIPEYELGKDYRTAGSYCARKNTEDGAVVYSGDEVIKLVRPENEEGYQFNGGYQFDDIYMEFVYDEKCWKPYKNTEHGKVRIEKVTGTTRSSSRLRELESKDRLCDDIGNQLNGTYKQGEDDVNQQPPRDAELEPLYQVGNSANIRYSSDGSYYIRDYIKSMKFFYCNPYSNEIYNGTTVECTDSITSLEAIRKSTEAVEKIEGAVYDDIRCEIEYVIGQSVVPGDDDKLTYEDNGLIYKEVVRFVKEKEEYYLKKPRKYLYPRQALNVSAHSISYPIYTYIMVQNKEVIFDNNYGVAYEDAVADVTLRYDREVYSVDETPGVMLEYAIHSSVPQKVDGDIYIDRGMNAALEKHIKLGEVVSLEALEQYGNGYYKQQT